MFVAGWALGGVGIASLIVIAISAYYNGPQGPFPIIFLTVRYAESERSLAGYVAIETHREGDKKFKLSSPGSLTNDVCAGDCRSARGRRRPDEIQLNYTGRQPPQVKPFSRDVFFCSHRNFWASSSSAPLKEWNVPATPTNSFICPKVLNQTRNGTVCAPGGDGHEQ